MSKKTKTDKTENSQSHSFEDSIGGIEERIEEIIKETASTEQRLNLAKDRVEVLKEQYEEMRRERQKALVDGKDPQAINKGLKDAKDSLGETEDEIIGLQGKLEQLEAEEVRLENEKEETRKELLKFKLKELVPKYNETAAALAGIVKQIWNLKMEIREPYNWTVGSNMGWEDNALDKIPQLYLPGQEVDRYSYFHYFTYRQERMKEISKVEDSKTLIEPKI